jgi:hypothetical protein
MSTNKHERKKKTYNFKNFTIGEQIVGMVSGATATVSNTLLAEVISDTGEILYIENKYPIPKILN